MEKILTVVIPTYNMERYLRRCLNSLIIDDKELFDKLEALVVNDGSRDSSSDIAHEYQDKYPNVFRVIDKENGNYGSCVNRGLKEANGRYFRLLDADDMFVDGALKAFLNMILSLSDEVDVICTPYQVDYIETEKKVIYRNTKIDYNSKLDLEHYVIPDLNYSDFAMHALSFNTSFVRGIGYVQQEGISYTDTEYVYYPFTLARSLIAFDIVLYNYIVGISGQTMSIDSMIKNQSHYWKLLDRFLHDGKYKNGNINAIKIRRNIILALMKAVMDIYLLYSPYSRGKEKRIRELLLSIKESDNQLFRQIILTRKKVVIFLYLIWYILGRTFFVVRKVIE